MNIFERRKREKEEEKVDMHDIQEKIRSGGRGVLEVIEMASARSTASKQEIMREVALAGYGEMVGEHIDKFDGVDHNILAKIMVSQAPTGVDALIRILGNLENISRDIRDTLLKSEIDPERKNLLENRLQEHEDSFADEYEDLAEAA